MVTFTALGSSRRARHLTQYIDAIYTHLLSKYNLSIISKIKARIVTQTVLVKSILKYDLVAVVSAVSDWGLNSTLLANETIFCWRVRCFDISAIVPYHNLDVISAV